jgi:hypothetical protein
MQQAFLLDKTKHSVLALAVAPGKLLRKPLFYLSFSKVNSRNDRSHATF